ncbi:MAG: hypothetical protein ACE5G1_06190 [bacterium]
MSKRSETPLEERGYGFIYLVLSGLLAITTFWAIWDMIRERAPWQRYQMEFNDLEYSNVSADLEAVQADFSAKHADEYQALTEQLEQARASLRGEAFQQTQTELDDADFALQHAMQNYRFAKSEYDALWYQYKNAEHEGHLEKAKKLRPDLDALNEEVQKLKQAWDSAEATKAEIENRIAHQRATVDSLQNEITKLRTPITDLQDKLARIKDRKIKIDQYVLADFSRGNFEAFVDQVDRCTSCHVNSDKGGYDDYPEPYKTHPNRDALLKTHPISQFGCTPCHGGQGEALRLPYSHGFVKFWEHPLLNADFVEAGCNKCHANEMKIDHAPRLTKAKRMIFDLACYACHDISGYENMRKIGPPLNSITKMTQKKRPQTSSIIGSWIPNPFVSTPGCPTRN